MARTNAEYTKILISGHRNPDVDSITSAFALADLRRRTGEKNVEPICPGVLPKRAEWVFKRYGLQPPKTRTDVYVRLEDLVTSAIPTLNAEDPLEKSLRRLEKSGESSLPVVKANGDFVGMLTALNLVSFLIHRRNLEKLLTSPTSKAPLGLDTPKLLATERAHDVKKAILASTHNHFPILDSAEKYVGTLVKSAFSHTPPTALILVDHNETDQSVPGSDELNVIEVVDHHRIAIRSTQDPIKYTADVVGSTCTLVSRMFRANGMRPSKSIAGILLSGIVADTLGFMSPTTTDEDIHAAKWLEKLSKDSAKAIMDGFRSLPSPLSTMSAKEAIESDRKTYHEGNIDFSLSQVEETNLRHLISHIPNLTSALNDILTKDNLTFACLLVTDTVRGDSELIYCGNKAIRSRLPYRTIDNNRLFLPGVLSRKKQLLPAILSAIR